MATLLYHLWGEKEEAQKKVIRFYRFMAQYILDGLLNQWGKEYDQMHKHDDDDSTPKVCLFDQMPQRFSRDQLNEVCAKQGLSPGRTFLCKWRKARLIHQPNPSEEIYEKTY